MLICYMYVCVYIYIYIYVYVCMYVCMYIYIYIHTHNPLCQPLPCDPAEETEIQPLIWGWESISSYVVSFPEEVFLFPRTLV